jgi:CRISPR-associated protein Csx3
MFRVTDCNTYTLISFDISGGVISPADLANLNPPAVDGRKGVVLSGRGPVWLFAALCHHYHPTAWVGCFDPRLGGAVVVQTHCLGIAVGQVIS